MENENNENPNSEIGEISVIDENDDIDAIKEKFNSNTEKFGKMSEANKQLYSRAKKGEGFELKEGKWVKKEEPKPTEKKPKEKEEKSNEEEFGLVEKGYLRAAGITDADEIDLAKKLMVETGKELDVLIDSKYFKAELKDLQDAKATTKATSGVKGGTSNSKAIENPEYWIAKGVPPTPKDIPDRKARVKIHRAMMKNSATGGKKFYND